MGLAENLKKIRNDSSFSQSYLANELGITRQGYNHYETGKRVPPLDIMEKLCVIFQTSLDDLTGNSDNFKDEQAEAELQLESAQRSQLFAINLKKTRLKNGLTLKAVGAMVNVAESTMSLYESGKREPDIATLHKLSSALGVSVDYLLSGKEPPDINAPDGPLLVVPPILKDALVAFNGGEEDLTQDDVDDIAAVVAIFKERRKMRER